LVADDNADMRDYLQRLLEPRWKVEVVGDGPQALAAVRAQLPDLVLTDVMMPGMDGFQLLKQLRAAEPTRAIPVVMLSARAGEEARVEGLHAGADDYLTKPFSARELLARVETQLKLARLRTGVEEERARFYALLQQAPVPIIVYEGPELRIVFQNRASVMLTDGTEAIGMRAAEAFPRRAQQSFLASLRRVYEKGEAAIEASTPVFIPNRQGVPEERLFDLLRQPLRDEAGRIIGVIGVAFEMTGQVRARREVEKSEARFRTIFEMADVSIWEEDLSAVKRLVDELAAAHGPRLREVLETHPELVERAISLIRVIDVNPATLRLFGASSKDELKASLEKVFRPESTPVLREELLALADGARLFAADAPLRTLSGGSVDVAFTLAAAPGDESYDRVFLTLTDLSARKLAEREREARIDEMERAVRFGEMFAAIVGHDLRNPLSAITTSAGVIAARAESEKSARQARQVVSAAMRMERMITQLLDFTRVRLGGGLPLERTRVDLPEVARPIIEELEPVHQRQIRLRSTGDVAGNWDRDRLSQMLSNLAANACQHGTPGSPIDVSLDGTRPDRVRIEVHNEGVIPDDLLPNMFEPLRSMTDRRAHRGSSSGLGLGLYITQQIALAHGGSIAVESTEAAGTRFTVELPRDG
jgi:signal transduction histidine kinase/CheY-like chemotaxis protein